MGIISTDNKQPEGCLSPLPELSTNSSLVYFKHFQTSLHLDIICLINVWLPQGSVRSLWGLTSKLTHLNIKIANEKVMDIIKYFILQSLVIYQITKHIYYNGIDINDYSRFMLTVLHIDFGD